MKIEVNRKAHGLFLSKVTVKCGCGTLWGLRVLGICFVMLTLYIIIETI